MCEVIGGTKKGGCSTPKKGRHPKALATKQTKSNRSEANNVDVNDTIPNMPGYFYPTLAEQQTKEQVRF